MSRKSKALQFAQEAYDITVTGRNVQVTDSMKDYAMEKIMKIERFTDRIIDVSVIMDIQKLDHRVDIIIKVDHIKIKSHAITTDMYASIDMAVDKIESQLRRYKTKLQDHQAKGVSTIDMNVNVLRPLEIEEEINVEIDDENRRRSESQYKRHEIVKQKTRPLKVLTFDEAIMKMELSGDVFMVFRHEEDMKLKVIYRRPDGNFGVIEPEA